MTNALWCDLGQHAYPAGQQGSTTLKVVENVRNQWGGTQPSEVTKDVCAACAKDYGYRNLMPKRSEEELDQEATDIRERSGGIIRGVKALSRGKTKTQELEDENRDLRIEQLERELGDLKSNG